MAPPALADSNFSSQSITLEIIVKFSNDSDAGRRVDRLIKEDPGDLSGLADIQRQLRESTGFVLTPTSVTSGRELIFRIAEKPLLEQVKGSLAKRAEVVSAELIAIQNENPRLPEGMLVVRFRPSADETALLHKAYTDGGYDGTIQALVTNLCADSGVPVLGTAQAHAGLAVTLDRYALLEKLVVQLSGLDDVDYAQPNSTVQFMK